VTTVTWTITDASGTPKTCVQTVTVTDTQVPVFTACPANAVDQITNGGCTLVPGTVTKPTFSDNCSVDKLTYTLSGATTATSPATGINYADGLTYNVGLTTVVYTLTDVNGLSSTCTHTVWIQNLSAPQFSSTCPANATSNATAGLCSAAVSVPAPGINNPCNEAYTVTNDSPYKTSDADASGTYPVGVTTVTWTITDASGVVKNCTQTVTVIDLPPTITCPADITVDADFELPYQDVVVVSDPTYGDNCPNPVLTWTLVPPVAYASEYTPGELSGTGVYPSPNLFYVGVTTITYTVTDSNGNTVNCSFTVTVMGEPVITCLPPVNYNTDPGVCTATRNSGHYGLPTLVDGVQPITWTWTITDPDGITIGATGTFIGSSGTPGPPSVPDYAFKLGTSTILWRAENISGFDECTQTVTVTDAQAPDFIPHSITECVDFLHSVVYNETSPNPNSGVDPNLIKDPSPDYYTFVKGNITLDLTGLGDNCCTPASLIINWRIDFANTPDPLNPSGPALVHPSISGTGQPSTYATDIKLWGDGVNFTSMTHTISYWVEDCHGNVSGIQTGTIIVSPRPQIIKLN
jgi:hypothetical protein